MSFRRFVAPKMIMRSNSPPSSPSHKLMNSAFIMPTRNRSFKCSRLTCNFVVALRTLAQERINLVNEHNARLQLFCERKQCLDQLLRLAEPLFSQCRHVQIDKCRARLFTQRFRQQSLQPLVTSSASIPCRNLKLRKRVHPLAAESTAPLCRYSNGLA